MSENSSGEEAAKPAENDADARGSIGAGIGLVLLLHLLQIPAAAIVGLISLPVICVTQLIYVIPALIFSLRKGHQETAKGIVIAASITALLNVACNGFVARLAGFFYGLFGF